jgi:hypothetical protein
LIVNDDWELEFSCRCSSEKAITEAFIEARWFCLFSHPLIEGRFEFNVPGAPMLGREIRAPRARLALPLPPLVPRMPSLGP